MTTATTVLHVRERSPEQLEAALAAIFATEGRAQNFRLQGTCSAVLARLTDPERDAGYRYLICPPPAEAPWTPLLEVGERADGLDRALSAALDGCAVVALFVYGEVVSGYRVVREGVELDRYLSDPEEFADMESTEDAGPTGEGVERLRGDPSRFAELLPPSAPPAEFARIVLRPGWWEEHETDASGAVLGDGEELVDERDRMRCIGLALELWGPSEYPFAGELEDLPNRGCSPAIALAFA